MVWRPTLWVALLGLWAASCYHLTPEDKVAIVEQHNECRSMVLPTAANMRRVTWDDSLEALSEKYVARCVWDHNPDRGNVGENLFSTNGPFDPSYAVTSWYMEHQDYSYQNNRCQEDKLCGHYTQVVWADTYSVGCSSQRCKNVEGLPPGNVTLLVCNYAPRGNYRGLWPYKEGNPCSQCPSDLQLCENNLCVTDQDVSKMTATSPFPTSNSPTWSAPTDESPEIVKDTNQDNYNWQSSSPSTVAWSPALLLAVLLLFLMP